MSFQATLDTAWARTGQSLDDLRAYAVWQGYLEGGRLKPGITAHIVIADLNRDFGLEYGQAIAVYDLLKDLDGEGAR